MIIIEGTDGVGKTTLAQELLSRLPGYVYAHFTKLPIGFDYYWGYVDRISPWVVQDRFHMSEVAYAAAAGRESNLDPFEYGLVDAALRRVGAFTVLVTADDSLVEARWDQSQMYDLDTTLKAGWEFNKLADWRAIYRPDIDFRFHATGEQPYVTDSAINKILARYLDRRQAIARIIGRRPASL